MQNPESALIAAIADDLPVGVWVAKVPGGELAYANRAFREIMGMDARDDVGVGEYAAPYGIFTPGGDPYPEEGMPFVRALRTRETVVVDDLVIHRTDGRRVHVRAFARPMFDHAEMTHVAIAFIDITREVVAERSRVEGEVRLRHYQRMESIGSLAGGIAHDFNNMLASIKMLVARLARDEDDAERAELLGHIDKVTNSGAQLTRSLLRFARRDPTSLEPISLDRIVRSIGDLTARTIDKGIALRCQLGSSDAQVTGDASQLEQVVMNLVLNARDAMQSGGQLLLETSLKGDSVVLEVADTGHGIPESIRERIFEPYFTTKTSGSIKGTGLGLATVYGIVQAHGGTIEVARTGPTGTTMRLVLPRAQPSSGRHAIEEAKPLTPVRGNGATLLLIDDERVVRDASAEALRALGYRVLTAEDGVHGVDVFRDHHREIGVVLLDMVMPRMGGQETLSALRAIDAGVPVLLTTGLAVDDVRADAFGLLAKPYDVAVLSEAVARALSSRQGSMGPPRSFHPR